jgi:hypothetical protein
MNVGVNGGSGGNSNLEIDGSVTLYGSGTVNLGGSSNQAFSTGTVENFPSTNGTLINVNNTITGGGTIGLYAFDNQAGGAVEASQQGGNSLQVYGTTAFTNEGSMIAETGAVLGLGQAGVAGNLTNTGTIEAKSGGEVTISVAIGSGGASEGMILIDGNGTINLASGGSIANAVTFTGTEGTLQVDSASDSITGAIYGFATGDNIDARFMPFTSKVTAQWQPNFGSNGGTLTLSNGSGTTTAFALAGDYPVSNFAVYSDGNGGTEIQVPNDLPPNDFMIMSEPSGNFTPGSNYEIYDIGGNAILSAYALGNVASPWTFAGLGGFNGNDTSDLMLRNSSTGALEIYDVSNNSITGSAAIGAVGLEWQVSGFGDFSGNPGESDMIMRATTGPDAGNFEVYDISNNAITSAAAIDGIPLTWTVLGFGDFSGNPRETDMLLRNSNTAALAIEGISKNAITSSAIPLGVVGTEWQVAGFGDFSGNPGESDMVLRNGGTGALEVFDISHNAITSAAAMGAVGTEWTVAGFGDLSGNPNETDMLMRNSNTGAFEVYDISDNVITFAGAMGTVGLEWTVDGIAPASPSGGASGAAIGPLVQAMAGLSSGAAALNQGSLNQATQDATSPPSLLAASPLVH